MSGRLAAWPDRRFCLQAMTVASKIEFVLPFVLRAGGYLLACPRELSVNAQADPPGPGRPAPRHWRGRRSITRFAVSAVAGAVTTALILLLGNWRHAPAAGWDATAVVFCALAWLAVWPMSGEATAEVVLPPPKAPFSQIITRSCYERAVRGCAQAGAGAGRASSRPRQGLAASWSARIRPPRCRQ